MAEIRSATRRASACHPQSRPRSPRTKRLVISVLAPILVEPSVSDRPPMAERPVCAPAFKQGRLPWLRPFPSTLPARSSAVGSAPLTLLRCAWLRTTIMPATGFARPARICIDWSVGRRVLRQRSHPPSLAVPRLRPRMDHRASRPHVKRQQSVCQLS